MRSILLLVLFLSSGFILAQEEFPFPSLSPMGELTQTVGNTQIKVHYERPTARGRKIFGELVPWNKVWRTGAGYCTRISFSKAVKVGGQSISSGTYSLFTLPNPDQWMVILNRDTTLYGAYDYDPKKDVARFYVKPHTSDRHYESLTIDIDLIPNNAEIYISWASTQIHFTVETAIDQEVMDFINEELLTGKDSNPGNYPMGADYLYYNNLDLMKGVKLAEMGQRMNPKSTFAPSIKALILERLGYLDLAIKALEETIEATKIRDYSPGNEKYRQRDIEQVEQQIEVLKAKLSAQN